MDVCIRLFTSIFLSQETICSGPWIVQIDINRVKTWLHSPKERKGQ
jgi:hypothetical protein